MAKSVGYGHLGLEQSPAPTATTWQQLQQLTQQACAKKNIVKYHEETTLNCSPFKSNGIEVCLMFVFANSNKNNETKSKTVTATESQATHSNPVQRSVAPVVGHVAFLDVFLDVFLGVSRFSLLASQVDSSEEREEERAR